MKYANAENVIRCKNCNALYDKTIKWGHGYYQGTSDVFTFTNTVKDNHCPICNKENK